MQEHLTNLKPQLIETTKETEAKIVIVTKEKEEADIIKAKVEIEENEAQKIADNVKLIKDDCQRDLDEALPILRESEAALKCITPNDIAFLKKMNDPAEKIRMVFASVCVLFRKKPERKMDPATQKIKLDFWPTSQKIMASSTFLKELVEYKKEDIDESIIKDLKKHLENKEYEIEKIKVSSEVAANLAKWVCAMSEYYRVNCIVKPKKAKLAQAEGEYKGIMTKLAVKQAELKEVIDKVEALEADLNLSIRKKDDLQNQVEDCTDRLEKAVTLIDGLGGEKIRWKATAEKLAIVYTNLTGDVLVSSGMIAYGGAFTAKF